MHSHRLFRNLQTSADSDLVVRTGLVRLVFWNLQINTDSNPPDLFFTHLNSPVSRLRGGSYLHFLENQPQWARPLIAVVVFTNYNVFFLGAFDYLDTLPASPEAIGTQFVLYTNKSRSVGEILRYDNSSSLYYSHFNGSNPVKVVIHGFGSSGRRMWVLQMTEALLAMVSRGTAFNFPMAINDYEPHIKTKIVLLLLLY